MGKRRKRLTMPKYAKKYASIRATVARLRGETVETTESIENEEILVTPNALKATTTITNEEELLEINEPEAVEEVITAVESAVVEENPIIEVANPKATKRAIKSTSKKRRVKKTSSAG